MNICVIGNNLTGLALSKALVSKKLNVTIYCNYKKRISKTNRSIGITKENIDFFNNEILNIKKKYFNTINEIEIFTEKSKNKKILNFSERSKEFFNIIKSQTLYDLLKKSLSKKKYFKKKKIYSNTFYKNIIKNKNYDLIINCEKNNDIVKNFFSNNFKKDYFSDAYTCIILHKKIQNKKAIQIFTKYGPLAFLPLSSNKTSVVFSIYKEKNNIKEKDILDLIKNYNREYLIKKISKIEKVSLKFSLARNYFNGKVLLFGDGLHQIHPLAGQGFNMTLRDLKVLLDEIQNRINLGLSLDNSIFDTFERKTKHYNLIYSTGINFVQEFFRIDNKLKSNYSDKLINFIGKNKSINKFIIKVANKGISIN